MTEQKTAPIKSINNLTVLERLEGIIKALENNEYQNIFLKEGLGLFKDCRSEFQKNIDELDKRGIAHNYKK